MGALGIFIVVTWLGTAFVGATLTLKLARALWGEQDVGEEMAQCPECGKEVPDDLTIHINRYHPLWAGTSMPGSEAPRYQPLLAAFSTAGMCSVS